MDRSQKSQPSTNRADATEPFRQVDSSSPPAESAEHRSVRFYDSDRSLARIVAEFLQEGFETGSPGIVIATTSQRAEIVRELTVRSLDVAALQRSGDLLLLDGAEALSTFIVHGKPDAGRFREHICDLIERVRCGRADCTVRIFGQMVDILWQQEDRDAAIRLELLWNQFAQTEASTVVCGYAIGNFYKDARVEDVCGERSHFGPTHGHATRTFSAADTNRRRSKAEPR